MVACLGQTQPVFLGWVFTWQEEGGDSECLHQSWWCRRDTITMWCFFITIFWTPYIKTLGFLISTASKVTFRDEREHLVGDGSIIKKYRKYPAADLKLPLLKNLSHRNMHKEILRKRTERVGKLRIINMNILWILWCHSNNEVLKIKVYTLILLRDSCRLKTWKQRKGSFKNEGVQAERNVKLLQTK